MSLPVTPLGSYFPASPGVTVMRGDVRSLPDAAPNHYIVHCAAVSGPAARGRLEVEPMHVAETIVDGTRLAPGGRRRGLGPCSVSEFRCRRMARKPVLSPRTACSRPTLWIPPRRMVMPRDWPRTSLRRRVLTRVAATRSSRSSSRFCRALNFRRMLISRLETSRRCRGRPP